MLVLACLLVGTGLAVAYKVVDYGTNTAAIGADKPTDVSTTSTIDPLAKAAGLTQTTETHNEGNYNSAARWTKTYTASSTEPACVALLQAATKLGYTPSANLGISSDNCVARSGEFGSGSTTVATPAGQDISIQWTLKPATVTMIVEGPIP